ncbi:MAG: redoxin domain-containing protein [Chloroflexi bacterium]|nr:redoxin domain-containing protein [Chloroflexota bacterium]
MAGGYHQFIDAGAEVIAIVNDSLEKAKKYFQEHDIPFPCLADPERKAYNLYQVESRITSLGQRPGLFVIDRESIVRYTHIGWQQWDIPKNAEVLDVCRSTPCRADAQRK